MNFEDDERDQVVDLLWMVLHGEALLSLSIFTHEEWGGRVGTEV